MKRERNLKGWLAEIGSGRSRLFRGGLVADPALETLNLDPHTWCDAPQVIVDALLARTRADIVIEAAQCGPIPAQVAQLLLAARASAHATGHALRIENASGAARESLAALGLETLLEVSQ